MWFRNSVDSTLIRDTERPQNIHIPEVNIYFSSIIVLCYSQGWEFALLHKSTNIIKQIALVALNKSATMRDSRRLLMTKV